MLSLQATVPITLCPHPAQRTGALLPRQLRLLRLLRVSVPALQSVQPRLGAVAGHAPPQAPEAEPAAVGEGRRGGMWWAGAQAEQAKRGSESQLSRSSSSAHALLGGLQVRGEGLARGARLRLQLLQALLGAHHLHLGLLAKVRDLLLQAGGGEGGGREEGLMVRQGQKESRAASSSKRSAVLSAERGVPAGRRPVFEPPRCAPPPCAACPAAPRC